ncbi:hypothetical protein R1flu_020663 [Riccia fluitans]|uniref:Uncharacterized protein n=1 Tax=Riccia fluitans TaxID=41844 RepID=A0ABD1ZNN3_9MARC
MIHYGMPKTVKKLAKLEAEFNHHLKENVNKVYKANEELQENVKKVREQYATLQDMLPEEQEKNGKLQKIIDDKKDLQKCHEDLLEVEAKLRTKIVDQDTLQADLVKEGVSSVKEKPILEVELDELRELKKDFAGARPLADILRRSSKET